MVSKLKPLQKNKESRILKLNRRKMQSWLKKPTQKSPEITLRQKKVTKGKD
jgi:hypothetical protein